MPGCVAVLNATTLPETLALCDAAELEILALLTSSAAPQAPSTERALRIRLEPVTRQSIAHARTFARDEPAAGLPELARSLLTLGRKMDHARPSESLPYFEEAAKIYRSLLALGSDEHLEAAARAISSLGLQYSLAHADDRSLAAKSEAAALARQLNHGEDTTKEIQILSELAHALAESGQFAQAATAQREIVDIDRGAGPGRRCIGRRCHVVAPRPGDLP